MIPASLRRFGRSLLYGFRRELRPYEAEPLAHALQASSPSDRDALHSQFEARERIQRWTDRVLYFSLPPRHSLPPISARDENYCYAAVKMAAPGGRVTAKLMTHRGLLSTLEFSKAPLPLLAGSFEITKVSLHPGGKGYTDEIHESEHGPKSDA